MSFLFSHLEGYFLKNRSPTRMIHLSSKPLSRIGSIQPRRRNRDRGGWWRVGELGFCMLRSIPETKSPSTWNSEVGSHELVSLLGTVGRCESFFCQSDLIFWIRLFKWKNSAKFCKWMQITSFTNIETYKIVQPCLGWVYWDDEFTTF